MNTKKLLILSTICAISGALFYALHQGWIIINTSLAKPEYKAEQAHKPATTQKKATLYYWHHDAWHHESNELVWTSHNAQNVVYLVNSWLSLLDDEKITTKKVSLQTAMFSPTGNELYISFDRSLLSKEATTYEKWMLIESLLKTLRENGIAPHLIRFLINHQPMIDAHLDFNSPWPIHGFIKI